MSDDSGMSSTTATSYSWFAQPSVLHVTGGGRVAPGLGLQIPAPKGRKHYKPREKNRLKEENVEEEEEQEEGDTRKRRTRRRRI